MPDLEAKPNLTALDVQIKKLRDRAFINIRDAAYHMREEATDVKTTLTDIEEWLERLQQIAEEVVYILLHLCLVSALLDSFSKSLILIYMSC